MTKTTICKRFSRTVLTLALIICSLLNSNIFHSEASITHAATTVQANFYLVDEAHAWDAYPNINWKACTYVGTGTINYSSIIYDNAAAAKKAIITNPNTSITWTHVGKINGRYYVAARLTDETKKIIDNKNSSEIVPIINPSSNKASTNSSTKTTDKTKITEPHILTREQILSLDSNSYPKTDSVKWEKFAKFKYDVADGVIPMSLINDPVYTSMNLPSETLSEYMISAARDNAHVYPIMNGDKGNNIIAIGSIYPTKDATLRDTNTINIGKIKVFGYNKSTKKWEIIKEDACPDGASLRKLPWDNGGTYTVPVTKYADHIEVTVTSDDMKNGVIHFWGNRIAFDKSKYSYYATAYTFWAASGYHTLTGVGAIDLKNGAKGETVDQLNASRGYAATYAKKTVWCTTIPNDVYKAEWGTQLQKLFDQ